MPRYKWAIQTYYVMRKGKVITDSIRFWEIIALETSESNVSVSYSKYFCWRIHVRINKSLSINHTVRLHIHVTIFTLAFRSFGTTGEGDLVRITRELKRQISHSAWHFAFVDPSADVLHIITLGHWIIEGVFHGWKLETLFLRVGLSRLFPIQCVRLVAIPVSREDIREDMFCYPYDVFRYAKWTVNAIDMNRNIGNGEMSHERTQPLIRLVMRHQLSLVYRSCWIWKCISHFGVRGMAWQIWCRPLALAAIAPRQGPTLNGFLTSTHKTTRFLTLNLT